MKMYLLARRFGVVAMSFALASCTTTPVEFNNKPSAVSKAALCKTALETQDPAILSSLSALPTSRTRHCASATAPIAGGVVVLPIVLAVAWIASRWGICTAAAVAIGAYSSSGPDQCKPHENRSGLPLLGNHLLTFQHAHPASVHFRHELELKRYCLRAFCWG